MGLPFIARYASEPTQSRVDNGLIEGDPQIAVFAESSCHLFCEAFEEGDNGGILPAAAMGEPKGSGEVMERDHRFDLVITHALEDGAVAVDGGGVPVAFAGFDAAPFYGHAVRVLSHRLSHFQISLGVVPPATGFAGGLASIDVSGVFPGMPVVVGVATFHLMRSAGDKKKAEPLRRASDAKELTETLKGAFPWLAPDQAQRMAEASAGLSGLVRSRASASWRYSSDTSYMAALNDMSTW